MPPRRGVAAVAPAAQQQNTCIILKEPSERIGTTWESEYDLVLVGIDGGSGAEFAGMRDFIGRRLTHVNGALVQDGADLARAAQGAEKMTLCFEAVQHGRGARALSLRAYPAAAPAAPPPVTARVKPNEPCPCGAGRKYKRCCGRHGTGDDGCAAGRAQAKLPSLRLVSPNEYAVAQGVYKPMVEAFARGKGGTPVWRRPDGNCYICLGANNKWHVTTKHQTEDGTKFNITDGFIVSDVVSKHVLPHEIKAWKHNRPAWTYDLDIRVIREENEEEQKGEGRALAIVRGGELCPSPIVPGSRVEAQGLSGARELNGVQGEVVAQQGERWVVQFDPPHDGTQKVLRPQNLRVCPLVPLDRLLAEDPKLAAELAATGHEQVWRDHYQKNPDLVLQRLRDGVCFNDLEAAVKAKDDDAIAAALPPAEDALARMPRREHFEHDACAMAELIMQATLVLQNAGEGELMLAAKRSAEMAREYQSAIEPAHAVRAFCNYASLINGGPEPTDVAAALQLQLRSRSSAAAAAALQPQGYSCSHASIAEQWLRDAEPLLAQLPPAHQMHLNHAEVFVQVLIRQNRLKDAGSIARRMLRNKGHWEAVDSAVRSGRSLNESELNYYGSRWNFRSITSLVQLIQGDDGAAAETAGPAVHVDASLLTHGVVSCAAVLAAVGGECAAEAMRALNEWRYSPALHCINGSKKALVSEIESWLDGPDGFVTEDGRRQHFVLTRSAIVERLKRVHRVSEAGASADESLRHRAQNAADARQCAQCDRVDVQLRRCKLCKSVWYCSESCQKENWAEHQQVCGNVTKRIKQLTL